MCPHIDLRAGGAIYPPAFAALAAAARDPRPIELYVILGVAHHAGVEPGAGFAIATDKDYATPFGRAPTGRAVIKDWSRRAGRDVTDRQTLHRTEHSVEFPLLFLHYTQARAELPSYEVVPVLLGSVDPYLRDGSDPLRAPEVADELQALREAVAATGKRALYVLSVDLAHIGPKFGGAERVDDAGAAACEQADRALLDYAQRFDSAPAFTRSLHADGNSRNVDAISGLYSLYPLLAGGERHGTLLAYGQNRQPDTGSLVSYASMAFLESTRGLTDSLRFVHVLCPWTKRANTVPAGEFKQRCLALIDRVAATGDADRHQQVRHAGRPPGAAGEPRRPRGTHPPGPPVRLRRHAGR